MLFVFRSHVRGRGFDVAMLLLNKILIIHAPRQIFICLLLQTCQFSTECAVDLLESINFDKDFSTCMGHNMVLVTMRHLPSFPQRR
jgi:hypothetical protein